MTEKVGRQVYERDPFRDRWSRPVWKVSLHSTLKKEFLAHLKSADVGSLLFVLELDDKFDFINDIMRAVL